jgi:hypothetical protein
VTLQRGRTPRIGCELTGAAEKTKLTTEREILRAAAKYFAGETNW